MNILVIAEHDNNNLKAATLNTLAAAQNLMARLIFLLQAIITKM